MEYCTLTIRIRKGTIRYLKLTTYFAKSERQSLVTALRTRQTMYRTASEFNHGSSFRSNADTISNSSFVLGFAAEAYVTTSDYCM